MKVIEVFEGHKPFVDLQMMLLRSKYGYYGAIAKKTVKFLTFYLQNDYRRTDIQLHHNTTPFNSVGTA